MQHQQREREKQHDRNTRSDRVRSFGAFLHGTGNFDAVGVVTRSVPSTFNLAQLWQQCLGHRGSLESLGHIALHRDRVVAVFAPHHTRLPVEPRLGNLRQRDRLAGRRWQVGVSDIGDVAALVWRLTQHDIDEFVALAVLPDRSARLHHARRLRNRLAANAQGASLCLVHVQAQHLD